MLTRATAFQLLAYTPHKSGHRQVLDVGAGKKPNNHTEHESWATRLRFVRIDGPSVGEVHLGHKVKLVCEDGSKCLDIGTNGGAHAQEGHYSWGTVFHAVPLDGACVVKYEESVGLFSTANGKRIDIGCSCSNRKHVSWATQLQITAADLSRVPAPDSRFCQIQAAQQMQAAAEAAAQQRAKQGAAQQKAQQKAEELLAAQQQAEAAQQRAKQEAARQKAQQKAEELLAAQQQAEAAAQQRATQEAARQRGIQKAEEAALPHGNQVAEPKAETTTVAVAAPISDRASTTDWHPLLSTGIAVGLAGVTVTIEWRDQGWGNSKGTVKCVLMRETEQVAEASCGIAPHKQAVMTVQLPTVAAKSEGGDSLHFSYQVGGGGGHELHLQQMSCVLTHRRSQSKQPEAAVGFQDHNPKAAAAKLMSAGPEMDLDSDQFSCPISCETMQDPCVAADGMSYERSFIEEWLKDHDTSPMTNETLAHKVITPNHTLRSLICEHSESSVSSPCSATNTGSMQTANMDDLPESHMQYADMR